MNIAYNINKNSNKQASRALSSQPVFGSISYFSCINLFLLLYLCSSIAISTNIIVSMVYKNITSHAIDFNIITNIFIYFLKFSIFVIIHLADDINKFHLRVNKPRIYYLA